ncbi:hypothetical protein LB561_28065 [Mesorhizobium sp. B292B1B]|uniref:hypothetical protein n=1 Tax=unclassified Mesorhizobium TaxID=325217 RepID=UPI00112A6D59|nr:MULTISPECIES: hypothetical protein [unclassified Mesorhizobium]MBZ9966609.1 hypothetical protein [Mesorhizobium sp. BR1-1-2]MCA0014770.1 hypothetical protein [Mesorhizobium sp. B294B1A1]MCA0041109.1 hypothetical protein [Mesorhizobium sp. B292B1B]TPM42684.1 hypothetical protein FJ964_23645 [Mesorhizobium sp. B2-3-2]
MKLNTARDFIILTPQSLRADPSRPRQQFPGIDAVQLATMEAEWPISAAGLSGRRNGAALGISSSFRSALQNLKRSSIFQRTSTRRCVAEIVPE